MRNSVSSSRNQFTLRGHGHGANASADVTAFSGAHYAYARGVGQAGSTGVYLVRST